jgi:hypothetical protein
MYYIFITDRENAFLNSILPPAAAAFSLAYYPLLLPSVVPRTEKFLLCYDVKYGFTVPWYRKWYYSGLLSITINLMTLVIIEETGNLNIRSVKLLNSVFSRRRISVLYSALFWKVTAVK